MPKIVERMREREWVEQLREYASSHDYHHYLYHLENKWNVKIRPESEECQPVDLSRVPDHVRPAVADGLLQVSYKSGLPVEFVD